MKPFKFFQRYFNIFKLASRLSADIRSWTFSIALDIISNDLLFFSGKEKILTTRLQQLQNQFPDVSFDFNHHYVPTAKPRHYAADMIHWSDTKACIEPNTRALSIGLIDGLPDVTHPALKAQSITTQSFLEPQEQADTQHATAIAGILAGSNQPTLLSNIHLMSAVVLRRNKNTAKATTTSIVQAINWLSQQQVRLINISLAERKAIVFSKKPLQ